MSGRTSRKAIFPPLRGRRGGAAAWAAVAALGMALAARSAAAAAPAAASPAAAPEQTPAPPGQTYHEAARYKGWSISGVEIRGLHEKDLVDQIRDGIYLTGKKVLIFTERPELYPRDLRDDLQRIRLFLARNGYPYARVQAGFEPEAKASRVKVIFQIDPGPAVLVGEVQLVGLPNVDLENLKLPLRQGQRFDEADLQKSTTALVEGMRKLGHARAAADSKVTPIDSVSVRVEFDATPGAIYTWSGATQTGATDDLGPLVIKTMNVPTGKTFRPETVNRAQENLRQLGLFSVIRLSLQYPRDDQVALHAAVEPAPPRSIEGSVGYYTDEQFVVSARWIHRNLLEAGRGVTLYASYSKFDQQGGLSFWWPAIVGGPTRGEAVASIERQSEPGYVVTTTGVQTTLRYNYGFQKQLRVGTAVQNVRVTVSRSAAAADVFVAESGLLTYLLLGWTADTSNDRLYPTRGAVAAADLEFAPPGFITDNHYWRLESSLARYEGLGGGVVLAGQVTAGLAAPLGSSLGLLPNKRFFAGGASSMRGFRRHDLGPMDAAGTPLGGEAMLLGSLELRIPIVGIVRTAAFVDVGQVWETRGQIDLARLAVAVGPGLRVATPVGPVRADLGYRLTNYQPDQPRSVLHLGIGYPF